MLGCIMLDPDCLMDVINVLEPSDFLHCANRTIYETALSLHNRKKIVDFVTLTDALEQRKVMDECGGYDYLVGLNTLVPSAKRVMDYAAEVKRASRLRQINVICDETITAISAGEGSPEELAAMMESRIAKVIRDTDNDGSHWTSKDIYAQAERFIGGATQGHKTGFSKLDMTTGGFKPGNLIVLGARPSMGKSALAVNVMMRLLDDKKCVAFFSIEMSKEEVLSRKMSIITRIPLQRVQGNEGKLTTHEYNILADNAMRLEDDWPGFHLYGDTDINLNYVRSCLSKLARKDNIALVVIDYLQLMSVPGFKGNNRNNELSIISRELKLMAKEFKTTFLVLSQLSRDNDKEKRKPIMSDLRDSGAIEQDADQVWFIHRPNKGTERPDDIAELMLAKNRNGPTGSIDLNWDGPHTRFTEQDRTQRPVPPQKRPYD